ncbi:hypothetical protein YWY31_37550 [Paenibacillus illinoisensis]
MFAFAQTFAQMEDKDTSKYVFREKYSKMQAKFTYVSATTTIKSYNIRLSLHKRLHKPYLFNFIHISCSNASNFLFA